VTVGPRTPITDVVQILLDTRYKSVPVVIGALLIGVVAREDITRAIHRAAADLPPEPVRYWRAKRAGLDASDLPGEASLGTRRSWNAIAPWVPANDLESIPKTCLR
jgi:hypothetical protein